MSYSTLTTSLQNGVQVITINRPDKLNAINRQVMTDLGDAIDEVIKDQKIHAAIITGAGAKAFVAGADIAEFDGLTVEQGMAVARKGHVVFSKIENAPKPVIAAVNGFALGGGCELAIACHFRVASDNAKFGQPEVSLGLIPGYGGTQRLTRLVGKGKAMELMMTGAMIDAPEALRLGLVNYVVPVDQLIAKCLELLALVSSKAPIAIAKVISCINIATDGTEDGFEAEQQAFGECFGTDDMKEGAKAFLEKRKPVFKGH